MDVDVAHVQVPVKTEPDDRNCFLCRKLTGNHAPLVGSLQPTASESYRGTVIAKYFTFELQDMAGEVVCLWCWSKVEEFHRFHGEIEAAHAEPIPFVQVHVKQEIDEFADDEKEPEALESLVEVKSEQITDLKVEAGVEQYEEGKDGGDDSDSDYEPEKDGEETMPKNPPDPQGIPKFSRESDALIAQKCNIICHKCSKTFHKMFDLQIHCIEAHNTRARVTCCNRNFTDRSQLLKHLYTHDNPDMVRCVVCSAVYTSVAGLYRHQVHKHTVYTGTPVNAHSCEKCGQFYTEKGQYIAHMRRHLAKETKQFYCKECDKTFLTNSQLKTHVKERHTMAFDFVCNLCSKGFLSKHKYDTHVKLHEKMQKMECPECHRWYAKSTIKKHILSCQSGEPKA